MSKPSTIRRYGKQHKKPKGDRLFVDLLQTPVRAALQEQPDAINKLTENITTMSFQDRHEISPAPVKQKFKSHERRKKQVTDPRSEPVSDAVPEDPPETVAPYISNESSLGKQAKKSRSRCKKKTGDAESTVQSVQVVQSTPAKTPDKAARAPEDGLSDAELRVLSWSEVCPPGDKIVKIAEASYAEVYLVTNERGTSIVKVIRMESPIKAQTKAQEKSGLVDEEPHLESDLMGELKISEWLADIPGFVVYKERYIVQGKACKELLETHQAFHKKVKRKDPDRLQFYPSPSRYLDATKFLVVELGDAGTALEDFELSTTDQLWDIFFHTAIALARAEVHIEFEHRDLHEGNLCIRRAGEPRHPEDRDSLAYFGHSGLEITILDYGLSRASSDCEAEPIAYDLERDLSLFTSEHAPQCEVYRQMRSFLLRGDRKCLPPKSHRTAYAQGIDGPITWAQHEPYTNVLWLAYIYGYLVDNFRGPKKELNAFKRVTKSFWTHLNPEADECIPGFASASDIVRFAIESEWIDEDQLSGGRDEIEKSILSIMGNDNILHKVNELSISEPALRRSPRRQTQRRIE
ncbi:uncharacterized protein BCR38DRAFT_405264 [Pseudomassariella vexata]|uniref:non-specific serine/threonine protein kinase n=1 Tax=Pseudomassariella vexata TaxID=1141098 RepID=A0A1Y2EE68_9PEZI|nr:uncharacterized protein BCR38DRAFT_405264 [Pseudomassariella vexata]ORY69556.1 hypothetical protein BCR38DRAFT_405264 [Pseudomassariella vexata]